MTHEARKSILECKGIKKNFYSPLKIEILKEINLTIHQGETIAIMGRSGQGKSTLLQLLGTLDTSCKGTLSIDGMLVNFFNKSHIRNQKLGFIFQSFYLLEEYSALDNVLMPAKIARKACHVNSSAYKRACDLLDHVGLSERRHFNTKLLSGGEKQRVAIARALCNDPKIILADEPSGNLDKETSAQIHDLLLNLAKNENKTLIVVTHDPALAALCDKTLRLQDGLISCETLPEFTI